MELDYNNLSQYTDEELIQTLHEEEYKQEMLNTQQMTLKIMLNSYYGANASPFFPLFNQQTARAITGNGRYLIKRTGQDVEEKLQKLIPSADPYWVYSDTDSCYFQVSPFVDKYAKDSGVLKQTGWVDAFYQKIIDPAVSEVIDDVLDKFNAKERANWIAAEREVIADSGVFVAKKKYTLRVRDNEGEVYDMDDPYIKIQGLEIIKGGTPNFSKKYLKEAIPVILDKTPNEIKEWFNNTRIKYLDWSLSDIAKTQGVSKVHNPEWGTTKNGRIVSVPFGSRVAVVTNKYIETNKLEEEYNLIQGNDKVQILFLMEPNPLKSEAFAFIDPKFAEIFKQYIDYDTTFEKFFVSPLDLMLKAIGVDLRHHTEEMDIW